MTYGYLMFVGVAVLAGSFITNANADSYSIGKGYEVLLPNDKCTLESIGKKDGYRFWRVTCAVGTYFSDMKLPIQIKHGSQSLSYQPKSDYQIISEPMHMNDDALPGLYFGDMSIGTNRVDADRHMIILNNGLLRLLDIPVAGLRFKNVRGKKRPVIIAMDALRTCDEMVNGEPFVEYAVIFQSGRLLLDQAMTYSSGPLTPSKFERMIGYIPSAELRSFKNYSPVEYWTAERCEIKQFEAQLVYRGYPSHKVKWTSGRVVGLERREQLGNSIPRSVLVIDRK